MTLANTEMAALWDGPEGEHWAANAERYAKVGRRLGERFLDEAAISPTDRVLDVGCGTGETTRDAARLAKDGSVVGVDLSSQMLSYAREAAHRDGLDNVTFVQADAQVHAFGPASFDVAISSFGVMFFNDPKAAFRNIRGALRPGGRLTFTTWRSLRENEWLGLIRGALAAGRPLPEPPAGVPGPFSLVDADHTRGLLEAAGFVDVQLKPVDEQMWFGADVADAYDYVSEMGIVRGLTQDLDEKTCTAVLAQLRGELEARATSDGVTLGSAAWVVTARAAG